MSEIVENTLTAYLGPEFQQRLMWQLLVEPEFAEKIIPDLAIEYFDDPNLKRLYIIILEYYKEFQKVPNLQNQSIHQAINKYKTPNNVIEEESLFAVIRRIELWNERIINKQMLYDGDVVQKSTNNFIKQQEYRKLSEYIQENVKNGSIKSKYVVAAIEEKFQKISHIGEDEDDCEEVTEGIEKALRKEFREPIATGIGVIDTLTGGGLGKGEIGVILTPSGVGKTTALTIIADTAYQDAKNVAQVIFEDTKDQIKRKHYTIWADSALSKLDEETENERVTKIVIDKAKSLEGKGRLIIKRFSQENTTINDIRNWMLSYQKKYGFKFDLLVLDYLDCVESHKKVPDRNEAELAVIKSFEALASDFNIPAWTAIQSNRSGFGAEFIEAHQSGGSIKRIQKAHFFMSVAKTQEQKEAQLANISILKARFAQDGQKFENCIFNNDTMKIVIEDPRYKYSKTYKNLKHYDENDINNLEKKADKFNESSSIKMHEAISKREEELIIKVNNLTSTSDNDIINDPKKLNELLLQNQNNEFNVSSTRNNLDFEENDKILEIVDEEIDESDNNIGYGVDVEQKLNEYLEDSIPKFEWTGETIIAHVIEHEVKIDEVNLDKEFIVEGDIVKNDAIDINKGLKYDEDYIDNFEGERKLVEKSSEINNEIKSTNNSSISEIEKLLLIDPENDDKNKNVYSMLMKMREKQNVVKKE